MTRLADRRLGRLLVGLLTFFAVTAVSEIAYTRVLEPSAAGVAVGVAAVATACGCALWLALASLARREHPSLTGRLRAVTVRAAVVVLLVLVGLELGLLVVGVPAHLVPPWSWGALAQEVDYGLAQLGIWPYVGGAPWARLAVLMLLVPSAMLMALLFFWPSRAGGGAGAAARRFCVLAIGIALATCGLANAPGGPWRAQGLLLLLLVLACLWLPVLRGFDVVRALGWTIACALPALILAPALGGSHAWITFTSSAQAGPPQPAPVQLGDNIAASPPAGAATGTSESRTLSRRLSELYGPLKRSSSQQPMLIVRSSDPPPLLRAGSLDRFDGLRFLRSDAPPATAANDIPAGADASWHEAATITIARLRSDLLVGAWGLTTMVSFHGGLAPVELQRAPDDSIDLSEPLAAGTTYTVVSYAPKPTPAQLTAAPRAFPRAYLPYTEFELPLPSASALHAPQVAREADSPPNRSQLVRGPALAGSEASSAAGGASAAAQRIVASPYGPMYLLARRLASGAASSYEVAARVERFLLADYTYDERPPLTRYRSSRSCSKRAVATASSSPVP